jgi:hypothetical protein
MVICSATHFAKYPAILPRIKICENRMNEAALKVKRIGEAVSIIRLRLRRALQDGSSSLREISCGSCCSVVLLRYLRQTSVTRRRKGRRKRRRHKDLRRAGGQSWQVADLGTFLSYSFFVIFLFYLPQKTLRLRASAGDSIVGCLLVCDSV